MTTYSIGDIHSILGEHHYNKAGKPHRENGPALKYPGIVGSYSTRYLDIFQYGSEASGNFTSRA